MLMAVSAPSTNRRTTSRRVWLGVAVWVVSIWVAIPLVRGLQQAFLRWFPKQVIGWIVVVAVVAAGAVAVWLIRRKRGVFDALTLTMVGGCGAILVWWTFQLWEDPAEAVHFIQYGVLGCLLFFAFRSRRADLAAHVAAAFAGLLLGTVDEIIQWLTPDRFWDFRDLVINGGAAALVQPALWRLSPPDERLSVAALRLPLRLAVLEVMLLMACAAATPGRLASLAERWPALEVLTDTTNPMVEYGSRFDLPMIGTFRSRIDFDELLRIDRERATEVAAELDGYSPADYGRFLAEVDPVREPFLYELRVHLFARDANLAEALKLPEGAPGRDRRMTIALREERLLETVFGATLRQSRFRLTTDARAKLVAEADPDARFDSRVARHLVTSISELHLRLLLGCLIALGAAVDFWIGARSRTGPHVPGRTT
jgi:hypothetical protein